MERAFTTLNTYGKSPDALGGIFTDFADALEQFAMVDITIAFKEWTKSKEAFPTPADIHRLAAQAHAMRMKSVGGFVPKRWTQVVRDKATDEILEENAHPRDSAAMVDLYTRYPGRQLRVSMRQD